MASQSFRSDFSSPLFIGRRAPPDRQGRSDCVILSRPKLVSCSFARRVYRIHLNHGTASSVFLAFAMHPSRSDRTARGGYIMAKSTDQELRFHDRVDAGRRLAEHLMAYRAENPLVVALARGGVVVGEEVARALGAPLEVMVARKLGAPGQPELGVGAIAPGVRVVDERAVRELGISAKQLEWITAAETEEMERRQRRYRGDRREIEASDRTVILVDDGLATGVTARAAIHALRRQRPRRIVFAAPVCASETAERLRSEVDEVVCVAAPRHFGAVGSWYADFDQTTDDEVLKILSRSPREDRPRSAVSFPSRVDDLVEACGRLARPLESLGDLDPLMEQIGEARYVLLGEASHGTSDYYVWRARISQRLIQEKGFSFIAVEGDWPDCFQVNRYVQGRPDVGGNAQAVLRGFTRWPTWMWGNWELVALAEWLRRHNASRPEQSRVGFYGLDVYSLWESLDAVLRYLERVGARARILRAGGRRHAHGASAERAGARRRRQGGAFRRRAERPGGSRRRELLPGHGPGRRGFLERAGPAHGRHAGADHALSRAPGSRHRVGAQHARRRRPGHRHGAGRHAERRAARPGAARSRGSGAGRVQLAPWQRHRRRGVGVADAAHARSPRPARELGRCAAPNGPPARALPA